MHLCFVAPHAWPVLSGDKRIAEVGGAEVQQCILARLFAANGYRVSMICLDYGQPERTMIEGVTVHKTYRPHGGVPVLRFVHPRLTAMWRALREADAEVYYCRAAGMLAGVVAEFCRRHGRRSIYAGASDMDFVRSVGGQVRYARDRWLYRRGLALADRIVAQNEVQRSTCRATYGRDAVVIPSCYQPPARRDAGPARKDSVLWVGVMREGKRPVMYVCPPRMQPTRAEAASLPNVEFTGFLALEQVEPRFDAARVFVNTSEFEGLPNTFLQAWARGVPTLGTVAAGSAGHRQFHDVEAGARQIEALFEDRALWERASKECREHFERTHSGAETLARYGRLFEGLAA